MQDFHEKLRRIYRGNSEEIHVESLGEVPKRIPVKTLENHGKILGAVAVSEIFHDRIPEGFPEEKPERIPGKNTGGIPIIILKGI